MSGTFGLRARVSRRTRAAIDRWRRPRRSEGSEANILAVSDLHLGFDLRRGASRAGPPHQDAPLAALLEHHEAHRAGGRPWRLVIAGDMVDFIGITLTPEPTEEVPFEVSATERLGGLWPEPSKAVWKLRRVLERHRLFFARLAAFVAAGNELVVIRGNHDQEWSLPEVQEAFTGALADLALPRLVQEAARRARLEAARRAFLGRIRFHDWFYLEPGRLYVEHGHLHDEFASVADFGRPPGDAPPRALHESVSTLALRLFSNRHEGLDMNDVERWALLDFVRWAIQSGEPGRILWDYLAMAGRVLSFSLRTSARTMAKSAGELVRLSKALATDDGRLGALRAMLRGVRADHDALARDLLGLLRPPAEESVLACAQLLHVDRLLVGMAALAGLASCAAARATPHGRAGGLALVVAAALGLNYLLTRIRRADSHPKLLRAAHRLAVIFGVDFVVMGHSHRAVDQAVGAGARYFNLGTWLTPSRDENGALSFPHLVITGSRATLRHWQEEKRQSVVA